jgi:hypothetical protein
VSYSEDGSKSLKRNPLNSAESEQSYTGVARAPEAPQVVTMQLGWY